ncbi:MAG: ABC transporter ATP-binding protein [Bacteroidota bacterium]
MSILSVHGLTKSYGGHQVALADCSFKLERGKICAVIGASGCGKSTLLRLIAGLERPDAGKVSLNDQVVSSTSYHLPPQKRNVGFVFQDYSLFPHLTVAQNIGFGLNSHQQTRVTALLDTIKMPTYGRRYPHQLSGGQAQRVALARTLAREPALLLLDEPFSSLDTHLKAELRREIGRIMLENDMTTLFVTHDIFDAIDLADEILFLADGQLIDHGPVAEVLRMVNHPYIQACTEELQQKAMWAVARGID